MKRQKRDIEERAFKKGYQAGITGKSKSLCQISNPTAKQNWLSGWREGRGDNWDGLIGVSGLHKLPGIST